MKWKNTNETAIARDLDATVIKNTGDSLIYYFPKTADFSNESAFKSVFECGLTMILGNITTIFQSVFVP